MTELADEKQMRLRYAGTCRRCGAELAARTEAIYERSTRTVRCLTCSGAIVPAPEAALAEPPGEIDPGIPGASARRKFERRQSKRETRIRTKHPKIGGLVLAMSDDPQSTRAWNTGAVGEERIGEGLNRLASPDVRVLHDRRVPRRTSNIDHLAVTSAGVFVIDAKRYRGRPELWVEGGLFRPRTETLLVARRDRTKLVDGMLGQIEVVRNVLGDAVPVRGVLCFVDADWPVVGGSFATRGVDVLWPRRLYKMVAKPGPVATAEVAELHSRLAAALPPA